MRARFLSVRCLVVVLVAALLGGPLASAEPPPAVAEALKQLQAAVQKEIESKPSPPEGSGRPDGARIVAAQLDSAVSTGDTERLDERLAQYSSYLVSEEARSAMTALRAAVKQVREAKEAVAVAEANAALKQAADAVHSARSPEEMDAPMQRLAQLRTSYQSGERSSEATRGLYAKVDPALSFLRYWQDYLAAQKKNSAERARQSLQQLLNNSSFELTPRSQILAELEKYPINNGEAKSEPPPQPEEIDKIVAAVKTLDELPNAIRQLQRFASTGRSYPTGEMVNGTLAALVSLDRTYREFQAGLPTRLDPPQNYSRDLTSAAVAPLKAKLILLILPRYLNAPADLTPGANETVQAYLQRAANEARARGNSDLAMRVRNCETFLTTGILQGYSQPKGQILVEAGNNQELAGQYMLAVISYQTALREGGDVVPAKAIGERLAAIKEAHAVEYGAGMAAFLNPAGPDYRSPLMFPTPGASPDRSSPPSVLAVPGASPRR